MAKNLVLGQILVQMRAAIFYIFILFFFKNLASSSAIIMYNIGKN